MSVDVVTFGCRLNIAESEMVRREAEAAGIADAVIVNTCAVTGEAVRQARQAIRRSRRERPEARIIVTGCAVQAYPQKFLELPDVALVLGNDDKISAKLWRELADDLADTPEMRGDLLDYYEEIEYFDRQLGRMMASLEKAAYRQGFARVFHPED